MQEQIVLTGGCLCGANRYTVNAELFAADYCHCKMCQRSTGSVVGVWMGFLIDQVVWQLQEQFKVFASS